VAVSIIPLILVGLASVVVIIYDRARGKKTPPEFFSVYGAIIWLSSLIGLATSGNVVAFSDHGYQSFGTSYEQFLCAACVLTWVYVSLSIVLDALKFKIISRTAVSIRRLTEILLLVFLFAASVTCTKNFDGSNKYCANEQASHGHKNECTTYRASIFFAWLSFYVLLFKVIKTIRSRGGSAVEDPAAARARV